VAKVHREGTRSFVPGIESVIDPLVGEQAGGQAGFTTDLEQAKDGKHVLVLGGRLIDLAVRVEVSRADHESQIATNGLGHLRLQVRRAAQDVGKRGLQQKSVGTGLLDQERTPRDEQPACDVHEPLPIENVMQRVPHCHERKRLLWQALEFIA